MDNQTIAIILGLIAWVQLNVFFLLFMYRKSNAIKKSRFVQDLEFLEGFYKHDGVNAFNQEGVLDEFKYNMKRRKNDN